MRTLLGVMLVALSFQLSQATAQEASHGDATHLMLPPSSGMPSLPGQDAFGAGQEIVQILQSDPSTDWSKVNMDQLREHLIDMNEVALGAKAVVDELPDGVSIHVSGEGRTLEAIQRLIPAQARELGRSRIWRVTIGQVVDGVVLTVQAGDPNEVAQIKGLGYFGLITNGSHHQMHHLMIASGQQF